MIVINDDNDDSDDSNDSMSTNSNSDSEVELLNETNDVARTSLNVVCIIQYFKSFCTNCNDFFY